MDQHATEDVGSKLGRDQINGPKFIAVQKSVDVKIFLAVDGNRDGLREDRC